MNADHSEQLVIALRQAAQSLAGHHSIRDQEETLRQIVAAAVETVPGIDDGSILLTQHGRIETHHPTSAEIDKLDQGQSELGEGPCINALQSPPESGVVVANDFAAEEDQQRWPRFAPRAVDAGYRSLISTSLQVDGPSLRAALNLYSASPHAFDDDTRALAGLFGAQAGLLLYGSHTAEHLGHALDSRDLLGQAKGILMERFTVDAEAAFQMLVKSSQDTNLKLTTVAQWLTSTSAAANSTHDND